jgi:hypothetical protein
VITPSILLNPRTATETRAYLADASDHGLGGPDLCGTTLLIANFRIAPLLHDTSLFGESLLLFASSLLLLMSSLFGTALVLTLPLLAVFLLALFGLVQGLLSTDPILILRTRLAVVPCALVRDALLEFTRMADHKLVPVLAQLAGIAALGETPAELGIQSEGVSGQHAVKGGEVSDEAPRWTSAKYSCRGHCEQIIPSQPFEANSEAIQVCIHSMHV